ncbi:MAG: DUF819 domain-containing protein [Syntrophales bacterium]
MVTDDFAVVSILLAIEAFVLVTADMRQCRRFYSFLPPMFWIYFLPMLVASAGIIPHESRVYTFISSYFLPASLVLLLICVDIRAILRLGVVALVMMFAGSAGIIIGGPIALMIYKPWLPEGIWSGFGALSGSWIGGSANMIAIKEGIGTPDHIFFPMIVLDTIVSYSWMGLVIAFAYFQKKYDTWNRSRRVLIDELNNRISDQKNASRAIDVKSIVLLFSVAFIVSQLSSVLGRSLPEVKNVISSYTWTIIIVSLAGISLSVTRLRRLESAGASKVGYGMLYFVLASIGVRGNIFQLTSMPVLIMAGLTWLSIHAAILVAVSRLIRAPMFFVAVSSQANVGGPVSAPVVAEIYQPGFASVGVLMAVVGNITGTFLGIFCAQLCRLVG